VPEELGADVQVLRMSRWLQLGEEGSPEIILRAQVRAMWTEVLQILLLPKQHVIVGGSPGTGKSRTLMCLLRELLRRRKTVIFEAAEDETFFRFTPLPAGGYVAHATKNTKASFIEELENPDNHYLIDPTEKYSLDRLFRAHVVLASSPNAERYKNVVKKAGVNWLFVTMATEEELLAMRPVLRPDLTEDDVKQRFYELGGILRHIFADTLTFNEAKQDMVNDVDNLAVSVLRQLDEGKIHRLDERKAGVPSSRVCGFECITAPYSRLDTKVVIVSQLASELLGVRWLKARSFASLPTLFNGVKGVIFEQIALKRLSGGGDFKFVDLEAVPRAIGTLHIDPVPLRKTNELAWAESREALLVPWASNEACIDALGPVGAFQMTVSTTHSLNRAGALAILDSLGTPAQLPIYMVVPAAVFDNWCKNAAPRFKNATAADSALLGRLHRYALCIPDPAPDLQAAAALTDM
jgi:DNA polymerase III delta prime subunit